MAADADVLDRSFARQDAVRLALAATGVVVWEWTLGEDTVYWGEGLENVYGRPGEDVTFSNWTNFIHPDDLPRITERIDAAIARKSSYEGEFRVYWPDGSEHWVLVRGHVYENEGNRPRLAGMLMNITARKQEEFRRRDREERLKAALTASGTGTFRWDMRTNQLEWDEELDLLFGLKPGESVRSLDQFLARVHPDDRQEVIRRCEECVRLGTDFEMEFRVIWPDGSQHWLYDRGKTYFEPDGTPSYITGACVDVTDRKLAENALRDSERDLRLIMDAVPALVSYIDRDLIYQRANRTYEDWVGIPPEKIVGTHLRDLWGEDLFNSTIEHRTRVLHGERVSFEAPTLLKGMPHTLEVNFIPCRDERGEVIGFASLTLDITARKQAEEALRKQEKLALVGRLASSIAHEINNPLEAVTNLLYLAEHTEEPQLSRSYVQTAQRELARVSQIAIQALQFHRPHAGPKLVDVCKLLDSIIGLFEARLRNSSIVVEKDYCQVAPVMAKENELRQVFANILSNACDAFGHDTGSHQRRVALRVRERRDASGQRYVYIMVADSGLGMGPETQRRLFEAFFSTKDATGTGLGLWISNEIVTRHKGNIRVKSSLGTGTAFRVNLPAYSDA